MANIKGNINKSLRSFLLSNRLHLSILTHFSETELLLIIKAILKPSEYFFFYHALLGTDLGSYREFADFFGYEDSEMERFENRIIQKIRNEIKRLERKGKESLANTLSQSILPRDLKTVVTYLFLRDSLDKDEKTLFEGIIDGKYELGSYFCAEEMGLTEEQMRSLMASLKRKIDSLNGYKKTAFTYFKSKAIKTYRHKLCDFDHGRSIELGFNDLNYTKILWDMRAYEDGYDLALSRVKEISDEMEALLEKYFGIRDKGVYDIHEAEREFNFVKFGFKRKYDLPLAALYKTALDNKTSFNQEQFDYLMAFVFDKCSKKTFVQKYPESSLLKVSSNGQALIKKLEEMYFGLADYGKPNIPKGLEDDRKKRIDSNIYSRYFYDPHVDLTITEREILDSYYVKGVSYEEISKRLSISKKQVSSKITDALRKIDFYRFGITEQKRFSESDYRDALRENGYTALEKEIIDFCLNTGTRDEAIKKFGISERELENLMKKFYESCLSKKLKCVSLTTGDITREIFGHPSETLLSARAKAVLSLHLGIVCEYNRTGQTLKYTEIERLYPELGDNLKDLYDRTMNALKLKKLGFRRPRFAYMPRTEVLELLNDPRLPLGEKEKATLGYAFGLLGYPYKTPEEIAKIFGESLDNLKKRVDRSFVTMFRYMRGEIPGIITFEFDVFPNLRYFTISDRKLLTAFYKENKSYREIAEQYGLTYDQVADRMKGLIGYLNEILEGKIKPFDFSYYRSIPYGEFPYNGDLRRAKEIFRLYYEERKTAKEIIEALGLSCSTQTIMRTIENLKISTMKKKIGIKPLRTIGYEDVRSYYLDNRDKMTPKQNQSYGRFFKKLEGTEVSLNSRFSLEEAGPQIVYDYIEKHYPRRKFEMGDYSKDNIIKVLKDGQLSSSTTIVLMDYYGISSRRLMSTSEQTQVLRFLSDLDVYPMKETKALAIKRAV